MIISCVNQFALWSHNFVCFITPIDNMKNHNILIWACCVGVLKKLFFILENKKKWKT